MTNIDNMEKRIWRAPIVKYLEEGLLLEDRNKEYIIKKMDAQCCERGGVFYKRFCG